MEVLSTRFNGVPMRRFAALLAAIRFGVCVAAGQPGSFI